MELLTLSNQAAKPTTVGLDLTRGGCVGSILHPDQGELVVNDMDGRGIHTSGVVVHPDVVLVECGTSKHTGNKAVTPKRFKKNRILVKCDTTRNWNNGLTDAQESSRLRNWLPDLKQMQQFNLDIITEVSWINEHTIRLIQYLQNASPHDLESQDNNGFLFPIIPQAAFRKGFVTWTVRVKDRWYEIPIRDFPGWLHRGFDLYRADIDACAIYQTDGFGIGVFVEGATKGWYIKGMKDVNSIGAAWDIKTIKAGETLKRPSRIVLNTREVIEHV